jgi:hypothetical protein
MDWLTNPFYQSIVAAIIAQLILGLLAGVSPRFRGWLLRILSPLTSWLRHCWSRFVLYRKRRAVLSKLADRILHYDWTLESENARKIHKLVERLEIIAGPHAVVEALAIPPGPLKRELSQEEIVGALRYLIALLWHYTHYHSDRTINFIEVLGGIAGEIKEKFH